MEDRRRGSLIYSKYYRYCFRLKILLLVHFSRAHFKGGRALAAVERGLTRSLVARYRGSLASILLLEHCNAVRFGGRLSGPAFILMASTLSESSNCVEAREEKWGVD